MHNISAQEQLATQIYALQDICKAMPHRTHDSSIIKPIQCRILHLNIRTLSRTRRRCFPPSGDDPINLAKTCTPPSIVQGQPIHSAEALIIRSGTGSRWSRYVTHFLCRQEPRGPEVECGLAGGIEVVMA